MKINEREIRYEESFYEALQELEQYWGQSTARTGRKLASELVDFTLDTIAPNPFAFPRLSGNVNPVRELRRAVFRKNYLVIYRSLSDRVDFLTIYHTSRNPDSFPSE